MSEYTTKETTDIIVSTFQELKNINHEIKLIREILGHLASATNCMNNGFKGMLDHIELIRQHLEMDKK